MYKDFYAIVGDDKIKFMSIGIADIDTSLNEHQQLALSALSSMPSFFLIDKKDYLGPGDIQNLESFKVMINEEFAMYFSISTETENGRMIAAALSSNPIIVSEINNN